MEEGVRQLDDRAFTVIPPQRAPCGASSGRSPTSWKPWAAGSSTSSPWGPSPTTYARMGRFGSPYAQLDLTAIDPALVEFDRRTTAEDQFRELAYATHLRGGPGLPGHRGEPYGMGQPPHGRTPRVVPSQPRWQLPQPRCLGHHLGGSGESWTTISPSSGRRWRTPSWSGAAGAWTASAATRATWCPSRLGSTSSRGVRQEYPDCTFLLEGLGGAWEATETLLSEGGMQWAYSELFQNFQPQEVSSYLDHCFRQGERLGPLVHYSETHDNDRLAKKGKAWSLFRNRLCALTSLSGAFAFTAGVEWLATEKIDVHGTRSLNWSASPNLLPELSRLNHLLAEHPCFFDGAALERLSPADSPGAGPGAGLPGRPGPLPCAPQSGPGIPPQPPAGARPLAGIRGSQSRPPGTASPERSRPRRTVWAITLEPAGAHCLSHLPEPRGLAGTRYRTRRAQAAWAYQQLAKAWPAEDLGPASWRDLGAWVGRDPAGFLGALVNLKTSDARHDLLTSLEEARARNGYAPIIQWDRADIRRITPVPGHHWLLVRDTAPFAATLHRNGSRDLHLRSIPVDGGQMVVFPPEALKARGSTSEDAELLMERFTEEGTPGQGRPAPVRSRAPVPRGNAPEPGPPHQWPGGHGQAPRQPGSRDLQVRLPPGGQSPPGQPPATATSCPSGCGPGSTPMASSRPWTTPTSTASTPVLPPAGSFSPTPGMAGSPRSISARTCCQSAIPWPSTSSARTPSRLPAIPSPPAARSPSSCGWIWRTAASMAKPGVVTMRSGSSTRPQPPSKTAGASSSARDRTGT